MADDVRELKVSSDEFETVLLSHPDVEDAAVFKETAEQLKALVVCKCSLSEQELASFVSVKIPSYKHVRGVIHFIDKIPKDTKGKIIKRELEERELNRLLGRNEKMEERDDVNVLKSRYPDVNIPDDLSWSEFVMQNFEKYGDKLALTDVDSQRFYTYRELNDLVKRCCSGLIKAGLEKGDVLGMYCPNIPEFAIIYLATLQAGGIVTTANPLYTEGELSHQLETAKAKFLVTTPPLAHRAKESAKTVGIVKVYVVGNTEGFLSVSELFEDDGCCPSVKVIPKNDVAIMPFSSGTTGLPKGVLLTHYNLVADASITTAGEFIDYSTSSVILGFLPFFHSYGMVAVLSVGLYCGSTIVCVPKFEWDKFFFNLQRHKVTHVALVPPVAMMIAKSTTVQNYDLSSLVEITSGAAPLPKEVSKEVLNKIPQVKGIRQGYGMTELSPVSHMTAKNSTKHGTVGHLLPNLECKVLDIDTGETVGVGKDGEICIRGPIVTKGYLNNSEATKNSIDKEGWLRTGDVGHYDLDECFYIVDRIKELIKYKGYQVPPAELEALLVSHPDISDAAVIGVADEVAGELPRAYVVTNGNVSRNDVLKFVEESVAPYKKLRGGIEFVDDIPRSSSGKILRRKLKILFKEKSAKETRRNTLMKKPNYDNVPVRNSSCCIII